MKPRNQETKKPRNQLALISFLFIYCFFFVHCSYEETEDNALPDISKAEIELPQIRDNALSFSTKQSLHNFLIDLDEENLKLSVKNLESEGFIPLLSFFEDLNEKEIDEFLKKKSEIIKKKGKLFSSLRYEEDINLDDELISDDKFAHILNKNRELYVDGKYYIYTTNGLYFCNVEKKEKLLQYLKQLNSDSNFRPGLANFRFSQTNTAQGDEFIAQPCDEVIYAIDEDINHFVSNCGGGGGPSGGGSSGGGNSNDEPPILIPQDFGVCHYSENSLFQQVFGHTVKCNDYHDDKHRIQTKVWNENYLLWSSVGAQAKYQKKRFIGWSRSETSDGVRMGINHAIYSYKLNFSPYNAFDPARVIYSYKGINYDFQGNVVPKYPISADKWPFPQNETLGAIDIYIFGSDQYFPLKGKDANKSINELLSNARKKIAGLSRDMNQDKVGIQVMKFLPNEFKVTQADILRVDSSKATITLDWNFLLVLSSKEQGFLKTVVDQLNAERYKKLEIDMYGAALKNNVWKGKRITGKVN